MSTESELSSCCSSLSSFEEVAETFVARRRIARINGKPKGKGGGSKPGKRRNIDRKRVLYNTLLMNDYFVVNPTYDHKFFRRRFRMRRELFDIILNGCLGA